MLYISNIKDNAPDYFKTPLQRSVYAVLDELKIVYERVDTGEAITMDDCKAIDLKLNVNIVKTLFLCNRQKTSFFLYVTTSAKPFNAIDLIKALDLPRLSFASVELLQNMLGTPVGAATILSLVNDMEQKVSLLIDKEVLKQDFFGCSDGTTTGYMKLKTEDITECFLKSIKRNFVVVE